MKSYDAKELTELKRAFHTFFRRYDPTYRVEIVRVNISTPFLQRGRCKACGEPPSYYYYAGKPALWVSAPVQANYSKRYRAWIKRMTSNWYLETEPRYFNDISEFSFALEDKHYIPSLHNKRGVAHDKDNIVELLGCDCGATVWAFNQKSVKNRPEITNRKGRYKYPQRFDY